MNGVWGQGPINVSRPVGAPRGLLARRRTWYAEATSDPTPPPAEPSAEDDGAGKGEGSLPEWVKDPSRAYAEIQRLRAESAEGRKARQELKALQAAQQQADEKRLAEEKQFQALAETRQAKIAELEAKIAAMEAADLRRRVAKAAGLPEEMADRLKGATEDELKTDAESLKALLPPSPPAPGTRQTTTTAVPGGPPATETDEQRRARLYGGGGSSMFSGGGVVYHGDAGLLDQPLSG